MIYADNAATTQIDKYVLEAMIPWLSEDYANPSQPYSFARKTKTAIKEARLTIASIINASPEEIYFTSGGTESDNWAIKGTAFSTADKTKIITSAIEHHAILNSCSAIERQGHSVTYLLPDTKGVVSPVSLQEVIDNDTNLVSVMLSNNEIGTIEPIKELSEITHRHGALFHTDAVQAVGHIPVDVKALGIDMLSASAHKFNGPKGVGFLYIRNGVKIAPFNDGGSQEYGLRAGTENTAGIVGMARALQGNCNKMDEHNEHLLFLENMLLDKIRELDFIRNGHDNHVPGNISLSFRNASGEAIFHRMDLKGICISTGSACDSVNTNVSHVIKAIKVPNEYSNGTIRISLGKNNTSEDVIAIAKALSQILRN